MKSTIIVILLVFSASLLAHPFDLRKADSTAYFTIKSKTIQFKIKFPVHAYINAWVKSMQDYDSYAKQIKSKKEQGKISKYLQKHIRIFDIKKQVKLTIDSIQFTTGPYATDDIPQHIVAQGKFVSDIDMTKLIITNSLFSETDIVHNGHSEIEYKEDVYDFTFGKKNYFQLKLK